MELEELKRFSVHPISMDSSTPIQQLLHLGVSWKVEENPFCLEGRVDISSWNDPACMDKMYMLLLLYQEKMNKMYFELASTKKENAHLTFEVGKAQTALSLTVNTLKPDYWALFTSFHSKEEYMKCIGHFLRSASAKMHGFSCRQDNCASLVEKGLWFLMVVYAGLSTRRVAALVNVSQSVVVEGIQLVVTKLYRNVRSTILFPTSEESLTQTYESQPALLREIFPGKLFFAIDGTPLPCFQPTSYKISRINFASKYHYCCKRYFILVDMTGKIVYLSNLFPGNSHDKTMFVKAACKDFIMTEYEKLPTPPWHFDCGTLTPCICGDKAYPSMEIPENWELYITKSGQKNVSTSTKHQDPPSAPNPSIPIENLEDDATILLQPSPLPPPTSPKRIVHFDMHIAPWRTQVERTFAKIKRFQFLSNGKLKLTKKMFK